VENRGEKLAVALSNLIDISEDVQKEFNERGGLSSISGLARLKDISGLARLKEFCTIKCCTSRRGGHDYAMAKTICNRFRDKKVLVVSCTHAILEVQKREIKECCPDILNKNNIYFVLSSRMENARGLNIDVIFVNCSSIIKHNEIDKIYDYAEMFIASKDIFFVIFMQ
jgi:hypothetical protein